MEHFFCVLTSCIHYLIIVIQLKQFFVVVGSARLFSSKHFSARFASAGNKKERLERTKWEKVCIFMELEFKYDFIHFHIVLFILLFFNCFHFGRCCCCWYCAWMRHLSSKGRYAMQMNTYIRTQSDNIDKSEKRKCNEVCKLNLLQLQ